MKTSDPNTWNVIGHAPVLAFLDRVLEQDRVSHAYIFSGPVSVGKRTVAWRFAARLLKTHPGQLKAHPDLVMVQRERNKKTKKMRESISVGQIQDARARFQMTAMHGGFKVMIVEDAHLLSVAAANALLKTLEEPRGQACIILTTTDATLLLPTIRSRSQILRLQPVSREVICDGIMDRVDSRDEAHILAGLSAGSPGVAVSLAEDAQIRTLVDERYSTTRACLSASVPVRILAARATLPAYDEDHVKTRIELLARLNALEVQARDVLLQHVDCQDLAAQEVASDMSTKQLTGLLHGLPPLRVQLGQHLNPKLALIQLMMRI